MNKFVLRRLILTIPVLLGVSVLVFAVIHLTPGDPAQLMLGPDASPQELATLREELGLDRQRPVQFVAWLGKVVQGDLGRSLWLKRPVLHEVIDKFKATVVLAAAALALSAALGILLGIVSATRHNSALDRLSMVFALFGVSMPSFWLGLMLIIVFALMLRWLPPSGMYSPIGGGIPDQATHLVLPAVTLAAPSIAVVARLTRTSMLEVLRQDFVRTATAKGLDRGSVLLRHALKNALIPVVTVIGIQAGHLLGGAVIVETVFSWPGLGSLVVRAISNRDFPLVQGATLYVAAVFVLINFLVDVLYAWLDPRIRYS